MRGIEAYACVFYNNVKGKNDMKHTMRLNARPFEMIKSGDKTIELRLYDEKRRTIAVGDEIEFTNPFGEKLFCKVLALHIFNSFEELYDNLPLLKCGYTQSDVGSASYTDMEEYYTPQQQKDYGGSFVFLYACDKI